MLQEGGLKNAAAWPQRAVNQLPDGWSRHDASGLCERREDAKCQNCLMHSGFEPSVLCKLGESPRDMWTMAKWNFLQALVQVVGNAPLSS